MHDQTYYMSANTHVCVLMKGLKYVRSRFHTLSYKLKGSSKVWQTKGYSVHCTCMWRRTAEAERSPKSWVQTS